MKGRLSKLSRKSDLVHEQSMRTANLNRFPFKRMFVVSVGSALGPGTGPSFCANASDAATNETRASFNIVMRRRGERDKGNGKTMKVPSPTLSLIIPSSGGARG